MSNPIWRSGPPPSIGWWPASDSRDPDCFRWWNGKRWSMAAVSSYSKNTAAGLATVASGYQEDIEWTDRPDDWPERSKT